MLRFDTAPANPLYPAETMVANITLDTLQSAGPARDVILIGQGQSDLEDLMTRMAQSQGRTVMIPNPLPFTPPSEPDWEKKEKNLLYCGRIHPEKGLHLLLEAVRDLPSDWTIDIVGPWAFQQGGGGEEYLNEIKKLIPSDRVKFRGPVFAMDELAGYYARARIFCYPSVAEKGETFGLAPLEAMAYGCVPVVSSLECFRDFIVHDKNGMIFDHRKENAAALLATQIHYLVNNSDTTALLAQEALKVCVSHSPTAVAKMFVADFEKIKVRANP